MRQVRRRERKARRHGKPLHDILPTTARRTQSGPRRLTDDNAFVQPSELVNMRDHEGTRYERHKIPEQTFIDRERATGVLELAGIVFEKGRGLLCCQPSVNMP